MSNIYFDCEFTGLHKNTTLISIGMVDDEGNTFYAEFNDYDSNQVDDWIRDNVISKLIFKGNDSIKYQSGNNMTIKGNKYEVRDALLEWLSVYNEVQFVSDVCQYDFMLLVDLFGDALHLPDKISPTCHDINQDIADFLGMSENLAFNYSRERFLEIEYSTGKEELPEKVKHNSLYDAIIIKHIYSRIYYY